MSIPLPPAGTNPVMDAEGTHYGVARLSFVAGVLHQLHMPCDSEAHAPEWRPVPEWVEPAPLPPVEG